MSNRAAVRKINISTIESNPYSGMLAMQLYHHFAVATIWNSLPEEGADMEGFGRKQAQEGTLRCESLLFVYVLLINSRSLIVCNLLNLPLKNGRCIDRLALKLSESFSTLVFVSKHRNNLLVCNLHS